MPRKGRKQLRDWWCETCGVELKGADLVEVTDLTGRVDRFCSIDCYREWFQAEVERGRADRASEMAQERRT